MAKIPAGASLLFGALAESGRISQRKNGRFTMALKGVDQINWFTDRPDRVEGKWKPGKLLRKWNSYFANSEPNAQTTLEVDGEKEILTFEMFKPKRKKGKMIFNIKSISDSGRDLLRGLKGKDLNDVSLFIDPGMAANRTPPTCYRDRDCSNYAPQNYEQRDMHATNLTGVNFNNARLSHAYFEHSILKGASAIKADMSFAHLEKANLSPDDLGRQSDLSEANLSFSILKDANFHGAIMTDLTGNDIVRAEKADFTGANFTDAYLEDANLSDSILTHARLASAKLQGARLDGAKMQHANLKGAQLPGASLVKADLTKAFLHHANLFEANLKGAILDGAMWFNTRCPNGTNSNDPNNSTCGF